MIRLTAGFVACLTAATAVVAAAQESIDPVKLGADTRFLASDLLRGRDTGSPGHEIAAQYVVSRCMAMGLEPVGGAFLHPVPLVRAELGGSTVRTTSGATVTSFSDAVVPGFLKLGTPLSFSGTLLFVDPQTGRTSGGGSPVGAVALVTTPFRSSRQVDSLAALGFVGIVQLTADPAVFFSYRASRGRTRLYLREAAAPSPLAGTIPTVVADPRATEQILRALRDGGRVAVDLQATTTDFTSPNVACLLPGTENSGGEQAIAISAHLDHLGVGEPDATGDSIYNGFSDDAAGVAMLLEIARVLSQPPRLGPDVMFLFFTGEERGLLGSQYMAGHPPWAANRLGGLINLDAGAPPAPPARWEVVAGDSSELGRIALEVAAAHGWGARSSEARPNSDFFPFHEAGIPAIFIIPGRRPYDGHGIEESDSLFQRWDAYHRPNDEWSEDFPFSGLVRCADYALEVVREFAERNNR